MKRFTFVCFLLLFALFITPAGEKPGSSEEPLSFRTAGSDSDRFVSESGGITLFGRGGSTVRRSSGSSRTGYWLQYVGLPIFLISSGSYFLLALIAPVSLGVTFDAVGDTWIPLIGITATAFFPLVGPIISIPLLVYMANDPLMVPYVYRYNPMSFYGGFIALILILEMAQVAGFVLFIIGLALQYRGAFLDRQKSRRVALFVTPVVSGGTLLQSNDIRTEVGVSFKL